MARPKSGREKPLSIRFNPPLLARIKFAATALGLPEAEVIRMCVGIGLVKLKRLNFDMAALEAAILDAAERAERTGSPFTALRAAEDSPDQAEPPQEKNG